AEDINISGLKRTFGETLPFAERYLTGRAKSQRIGGLMGDGAYYIKSPSYNIIREGSKMPMNTRYSGRGKYGIRKARRVLASPGVRKVRRNLAYAANNLFPRRGPKPTTFESLTIEHGNLVVSGTEKVTDVYGCPADKSYYTKNFQLQPGNFLLFPKLSQTAANWVEYEFVQLVFEYKSIVPTNFTTSNLQNGRVYIATQMDVNKELWRTPDHFESQENKSIAYVRPDGSRTTLHGVECNPRYLTGKALKFVRIYNRDDELEKYDLGNTQMMVFGTGSDFENKIIGELHVSYKVKFKTQRVFSLYGYNIPSSMKMCDEDQDVTDLQKGSKMSTEHALDHVYESNIPFSIFGVGQSDDSGDLEGLMKGYTPGIKVKNVNAATNAVVTITGGVGAVSTQYFPKSWEEETINRRLSYDSTGNLIVGTSSGKLMNRCGDDNVPPVYLSYQKWNDNSKKYELTEIENEDTYNIEWKSIQFPPNLQGDYELTWKRRIKVLETSASTNGHLEAKIHPQKFRRYGTQTNSRLFALKESSDPVIPWKVNDKYQPNFYGMLDGNCDMPTYNGSEMHQKCFSRKLEPQASDLHNELSDGKGWIIMEETLIMHFRCSPAINDLGANEIWIPMIHSYNPDSSQISLSQEPVIDSGSVDYINPLAYNNTIIQEDIKVVQYNTFQRGNDIGLNVVNNFGVSQTSTIQPVVKHNECHTS
ncbi:MAG: hypothetical protein O2963_01670, partial [Proteobacteria bacterium]|nr:hypothetical protein [Pseudomonadota bacterium]